MIRVYDCWKGNEQNAMHSFHTYHKQLAAERGEVSGLFDGAVKKVTSLSVAEAKLTYQHINIFL